jgi:hypothetical protein
LPVSDMNISAEQWSNKIHFADSDPRMFWSKTMRQNLSRLFIKFKLGSLSLYIT